jgi:hypothetical protein
MSTVLFDTLKLADRLEAGGFTPSQAHAASSALADAFQDQVATKSDIAELKTELKAEFVQLEQRMTIRLGGMLVIIAGILLAAIRYLPSPIVIQSPETAQQMPHTPSTK